MFFKSERCESAQFADLSVGIAAFCKTAWQEGLKTRIDLFEVDCH